MGPLSADLLDRLGELGRVVTADAALTAYRDRWPGGPDATSEARRPSAAVRPSSIEALRAVVGLAASERIPIVPFGGGSNVVGAIDVPNGALVVDLRDLRGIGAVDPRSLVVRVEAGAMGGELAAVLDDGGYILGHDPQSLELSTVGGWVSTRATGILSTGYGGIEAMVAGLEVVLPDGTLLVTGRGPRSAAGPDLTALFIGAEGAFGIIAAVRLRVRHSPPERRLRAFSVPTFGTGLAVVREIAQSGVPIAAVRLYDPVETADIVRRVGATVPGCLLITVIDGLPAITSAVEDHVRQAIAAAGGSDLDRGPAEAWYRARHVCDWLEAGNDRPGHIADAIEVAADWASLDGLIERATAAAARYADTVWYHVSHAYPQGASVYVIVLIRRQDDAAARDAYAAIWSEVMDATLAAGGTITHHHGVGTVRLPWLEAELGAGLGVLRAVKTALDPDRLLNPGRLSL